MVAWKQATFDPPGHQIICTSLPYNLYQSMSYLTSRANILLDKCFNAKLGDFGFSVELPRVVGDRTLLKAKTFACTEGYYPPELCEKRTVPRVTCILMVLYFYDHKPNNHNPLFNHILYASTGCVGDIRRNEGVLFTAGG